eukprot:Pompholyxophrys_sp_v1_NODE_58_length_2795_cov_7.517518.p3 type:complete len:105 gc:universal NODE_58_length_2795_cov_7.517518:2371-2685(+)
MFAKIFSTVESLFQRLYAAHHVSFSSFKSAILRKALNKPNDILAYFSLTSRTSSTERFNIPTVSIRKLSSTFSNKWSLSGKRAPLVKTMRSSTYDLHQCVWNCG